MVKNVACAYLELIRLFFWDFGSFKHDIILAINSVYVQHETRVSPSVNAEWNFMNLIFTILLSDVKKCV